jgi:hypothetical protein
MAPLDSRGLGLALMLALAALAPLAAHASLIGPGRTVQARYYNGMLANPELEINQATGTSDPASLTAPVNYVEGVADGSTILVGDTQIIITNLLAGVPFCSNGFSVGGACADAISGFGFLFTGENILGVSVDAASSPDFLPVSGSFQGNTHLGMQLISSNEIRVDVTGDLPLVNSQLVLDLQFATTPPPPPPLPEPATLPLVGAALFGMMAARRRRTRTR